ncbi:mitochondrial 2-oxodicarboxylate carrier-like isoform X1 [Bombus pyrosoma]|uniref:mitochondrial 2-oxodicarboxylate carrier-like isoform X1 n=2 Tax=Bombus pyrosoma TaxID=396416 RepID=UPI001CB94EA7|nr:mitochondrial 2-oxodicarboxylate carrier-like isoform X1 [Bombus pyrosoma]XP_043603514.1 mitochondrial 2-oxodicarboxylate carrier-like isoform X1 [Bombus pyrosoma]XP_043603515.1 mitochondrial 2-oxodicarboxylate carrier-like isoform X1 [Bombus pyrosoma]XP_043603516.1 mitochondrial 2-oxodicarboxylate carrier-like isoform X1 [Bombus pyrosoma]
MAHIEITQRKSSLIKEAIIQIGAGGSAGFVEACIMHPMDLIKTRFQLQVRMGTQDALYYTGIRDCMNKMYNNEGVAAFWKGILPPIIMETPKRAVKFFSFEQYKKFFNNHTSQSTAFFCAGFLTGVTEAILVNPFEVVKVQMQSNRKHINDSPSTIAVTRHILYNQGFGLNGLNKGLSATIMRNAVFNAFYFGIYRSIIPRLNKQKEYVPELFLKFAIGFISGTVASCMNIPFDVAKSRIQGPQGTIQYKGTLQTIYLVYQNEGFRALYKGLLPKILRLGPGGAIMLIVYDKMTAFLNMQFGD